LNRPVAAGLALLAESAQRRLGVGRLADQQSEVAAEAQAQL
jgi:hypothetical protein